MAMIMDGKKTAEKIKQRIADEYALLKKTMTLAIVQAGDNPISKKFILEKEKVGKELGVSIKIFRYKADIAGNALRKNLAQLVHDKKINGIIIQLPLPPHMNTQDILNSVIPEKDVDVLSARSIGNFVVGKSAITPPVVGAIEALFREYGINYRDKKIVLVGGGRLVGRPLADWLMRDGIGYMLCTDKTANIAHHTKDADIIISGTGVSGLITGDMVQEGAVVIDAGTSAGASSQGALAHTGKLMGDVDFESVSKKASFITPVPGGVGPITVAMIFQNLLTLFKQQKQ